MALYRIETIITRFPFNCEKNLISFRIHLITIVNYRIKLVIFDKKT